MANRLWIERNEDGTWDAYNDEGAHINFGKATGKFTPGDLLKIALAGCTGITATRAAERQTGNEQVHTKIIIDGTYDAQENRYLSFNEQVSISNLSPELGEEQTQQLPDEIKQYVERACTIKRTLENEAPVRINITAQR